MQPNVGTNASATTTLTAGTTNESLSSSAAAMLMVGTSSLSTEDAWDSTATMRYGNQESLLSQLLRDWEMSDRSTGTKKDFQNTVFWSRQWRNIKPSNYPHMAKAFYMLLLGAPLRSHSGVGKKMDERRALKLGERLMGPLASQRGSGVSGRSKGTDDRFEFFCALLDICPRALLSSLMQRFVFELDRVDVLLEPPVRTVAAAPSLDRGSVAAAAAAGAPEVEAAVLKARTLAKFVGALARSPVADSSSGIPAQELKGLLQAAAPDPLRVDQRLDVAAQTGRLVTTVPWVCAYLTTLMSDTPSRSSGGGGGGNSSDASSRALAPNYVNILARLIRLAQNCPGDDANVAPTCHLVVAGAVQGLLDAISPQAYAVATAMATTAPPAATSVTSTKLGNTVGPSTPTWPDAEGLCVSIALADAVCPAFPDMRARLRDARRGGSGLPVRRAARMQPNRPTELSRGGSSGGRSVRAPGINKLAQVVAENVYFNTVHYALTEPLERTAVFAEPLAGLASMTRQELASWRDEKVRAATQNVQEMAQRRFEWHRTTTIAQAFELLAPAAEKAGGPAYMHADEFKAVAARNADLKLQQWMQTQLRQEVQRRFAEVFGSDDILVNGSGSGSGSVPPSPAPGSHAALARTPSRARLASGTSPFTDGPVSFRIEVLEALGDVLRLCRRLPSSIALPADAVADISAAIMGATRAAQLVYTHPARILDTANSESMAAAIKFAVALAQELIPRCRGAPPQVLIQTATATPKKVGLGLPTEDATAVRVDEPEFSEIFDDDVVKAETLTQNVADLCLELLKATTAAAYDSSEHYSPIHDALLQQLLDPRWLLMAASLAQAPEMAAYAATPGGGVWIPGAHLAAFLVRLMAGGHGDCKGSSHHTVVVRSNNSQSCYSSSGNVNMFKLYLRGSVSPATVQRWWRCALPSLQGPASTICMVLSAALATAEGWQQCAPLAQPFDLLGLLAAVLHDTRTDASLRRRAEHACAVRHRAGRGQMSVVCLSQV
eukprot:UC1_evm1s1867